MARRIECLCTPGSVVRLGIRCSEPPKYSRTAEICRGMPGRRAGTGIRGRCPTISAPFAYWVCIFQRRTASRSRTACVSRSQRAPPNRKRVRKHTCDLLLQRLAQQLAGAMQPCAHGLRSQTQEKSGFLDAHLLNVAHDKHDAVVLGQAADRSFQETADIHERSGLFGTELVSTGRSGHSFKGLHVDGGSPLSAASQRFVQRDAREPGREPRLRAEFGQVREGADDRSPGARPPPRRRHREWRERLGIAADCDA